MRTNIRQLLPDRHADVKKKSQNDRTLPLDLHQSSGNDHVNSLRSANFAARDANLLSKMSHTARDRISGEPSG
jgi:hypothetical protein